MTVQEFEKILQSTFKEVEKLAITKGTDYSKSDTDRLSNFRDNAVEAGITPYQLWYVYAAKHWNAISAFIRRGQVESEPVETRVYDEILYLVLLLALKKDTENA